MSAPAKPYEPDAETAALLAVLGALNTCGEDGRRRILLEMRTAFPASR